MSIWEALVLGLVQGLTEFLPVSSTAHVILAQAFFEFSQMTDDQNTAWLVLVHVGSALAVALFLLLDLKNMPFGRSAPEASSGGAEVPRSFLWRWLQYLVLCTLPAALAYLLFKSEVERSLNSPVTAAVCLLITGTVLYLVDAWRLGGEWRLHRIAPFSAGGFKVLAVGLAQAVALLPGISRSGMTISCGLWAGLQRAEAVRFSFYLGLIAILGATVFKLKSVASLPEHFANEVIVVGFLASFLASLGSLWLLLAMVKGLRLRWFGVYCWIIGAITLGALAFRD